MFIPPKQEVRLYNNNTTNTNNHHHHPLRSDYPRKSPRPEVTTPSHTGKVQLPNSHRFSPSCCCSAAVPATPRRGCLSTQHHSSTDTAKEAFVALVNTTQPVSNEVREIREHNQHLWKAGPDQHTPAFEGTPEVSQPFQGFCTFFINTTLVKHGWTCAAGSCPAGQSAAQTPNHARSCFCPGFLSSLHRLQQLFFPIAKQTSSFSLFQLI